MLTMFIAVGIATAFNLMILKIKLENGRYGDFIVDIAALITLNIMFGMTLGGMIVAMISSFIISFYLLIFPPRFS